MARYWLAITLLIFVTLCRVVWQWTTILATLDPLACHLLCLAPDLLLAVSGALHPALGLTARYPTRWQF